MDTDRYASQPDFRTGAARTTRFVQLLSRPRQQLASGLRDHCLVDN